VSANSSTSSSERSAGKHLALVLGGILLCLLLIAGLNLLVDPYRVFGVQDLEGFNAVKPDFVESLRMTTPYAILRRKPDALVLGTSRAGRGLSLAHSAWKGFHPYNAALPAVSLYEMSRVLQHAQAIRPLKRVLLSLDNRVFYADPDNSGSFNERRLLVDANDRPQQNLVSAWLPDLASSLLSVDALLASARTVRYQRSAMLSLDARGQWQNTGRPFDSHEGFRAMTLNTFDRYELYKAYPINLAGPVDALGAILRICHREGIDLRMLVPPAHAWHWEALRASGMGSRFDEIRRAIVDANEEIALELGTKPFPVWDFSGYVGPNADRVPASQGDDSPWFWETVHYKVELGNILQERIFGVGEASHRDYGVMIYRGNIEQHIAEWHRARESYVREHPGDAAGFAALRESWCGSHQEACTSRLR